MRPLRFFPFPLREIPPPVTWAVWLAVTAIAMSANAQQPPRTLRECIQPALQAARGIEDEKLRESVLAEIGLTQAYAQDTAGARLVLPEITDHELATSVMAAIAKAQAKSENRGSAKATLEQALARLQQLRDGRSQELLLHGIIGAYASIREFDEARRLVIEFDEDSDRIHAMIGIAEGQSEAGLLPDAKALLKKAARMSSRDSLMLMQSAWETVVDVYLKIGGASRALEFARTLPRGHYQRCRSLCDVASYQARKGHADAAESTFAEAVRTAQEILDRDRIGAHHLAGVVSAQADVGYLDGAAKTMQLIPDSYYKLDFCNLRLAAAWRQHGHSFAISR